MVGTVKKSIETSLREVVLQEGAPRLRRRVTTARHVYADTALADVDAEFEQLAVNARCTPAGFSRHISVERQSRHRRDRQTQSRRSPEVSLGRFLADR
jgi:hypothetical protein